MKKVVLSILLILLVGFFSCACANNASYKRVELCVYADIKTATEQINFVETKEYAERLILSEDQDIETNIASFLTKLWKGRATCVIENNGNIIIKIDNSNTLVYANFIDLPIF